MKVPLLLKEIEAKTEDPGEKNIINKILQSKESSLRDLDDEMKWLKNFKPATPEELKKLAARQAQEAAKGAGGQAGRGEAFPVSEGAKKK